MTMRHILLLVLAGGLLAACGELEKITPAAAPRPAPLPVTGESDAERADEVAPQPDAAGRLGTTIASLGDPARPGKWLETPLVDKEAKGRVVYAGTSVEVDLTPIPGAASAGSRMSLATFQALGASITDLPEVEVFRN